MAIFYTPADQPADWQALLAKPDLHWKTGYSARSLACSWTEARGFPSEVRAVFDGSGISALQDIEFLAGFPEHKVALPGGQRASQNDIFVLAKGSDGLVTIMVEGKVNEPFDLPVDKRFANPTPGEAERLAWLLNLLGLEREAVGDIGYQLLHRTASAILEARRFSAGHAVMLVHSFSQELAHFDGYFAFAGLFGSEAAPNQVVSSGFCDDASLYLGWAVGNDCYLGR